MKHAYQAETVKTFDTKKTIDLCFVEGQLGTTVTVKSGNLKPIELRLGADALDQLAQDCAALALQMRSDKARQTKVRILAEAKPKREKSA